MSKYKRFLKKECPSCGQNHLEVRTNEIEKLVKGITFSIEEEYIICEKCGYEEEIEQKRKNIKFD